MPRLFLSCALFAIAACAARPAIEPMGSGYKFAAGEVLRYRVVSHLSVDMNGTHPDFLMKGITRPLSWDLEGEFDNVVLDVGVFGEARIERRARALDSSGRYQDEKFGLNWSRERDGAIPEEEGINNQMDRFAATMISLPVGIRVSDHGFSHPEEARFRRLVMRQGMMYWPVRPGEATWENTEEMAVPILHDKIGLKFANSIVDKSGSVFRITAAVSLLEKTEGIVVMGAVYDVGGGATAEFDESSGRLKKLELDLRIQFSGKAPKAGEGAGDFKGVAIYRETQVLVE